MKMNEVIPGRLYVRGQALALEPSVKVEALALAGIDLVVNLWSRADPTFVELAAALPKEFEYVHVPIPDAELTAVQRARLLHTAQYVARHLRGGGKALVQCHAGRNRAGLLAALVIRLYEGTNGAEALAAMRLRRPNAIANPYFAAWLADLGVNGVQS